MKSFYRFREVYLIILITVQVLNAAGRKELKPSKAFPPLYDFDDYDECLNRYTSKLESTYCMVYAEIRPQHSSKLWRQISQHIAEYKFHYRRDRLFFGVCMEGCKSFPKLLDNLPYNDSKVINQITQFFDVVHKRSVDLQMRSEYHALVHNCLNSKFQNKFGLNLKTYIEYCERPEDIVEPVSRLLTAFSIRRNYYRLVEPYTSQLGMDLSYLDGVRSFCVVFVVIGHAFFIQYHHVKNPDTFENFAKSSFHLFFTNGTLLLEIFHVLSGLLLLIKFKDLFRITPESSLADCIKTFCKGMLMRYIRFLPTLALFIFVNATFFTRLQDGPFWRHLTEPGRTFGREKWLKNLLIFDNISESGFPHSWYMTTDWQLFAFYLCIVIAIHKYPQYKRNILSTLAICAVLIPFGICYFYSLEPCYLISPESFRFTHVNDEEVFFKLYIPFYTNLGGYLFGIVCGEIYEKYRHNEEFYKKISRLPRELFELTFWICIAIGIWMVWLGSVVIFKKPSIWTALYGGFNRNLWLLIVCGGLIVLGMFCKSLSVMNFLRHPAFRILARLSFQIYMWHFSILYLINGHKRDPIYTNHLHHLTLTVCLFLFSVAFAFVITIFIEYPFHQIANSYYKKEGKISKTPQLKS